MEKILNVDGLTVSQTISARKLASIRKVAEVRPILGADAIECVVVDGWTVVAKKGEFVPGDLCVYFEIDSVLPISPEYEFLRKGCYVKRDWLPDGEGFRLKTIKLRGQMSQGLVIPISEDTKAGLGSQLKEGVDLTDHLFIVKWDPPVPTQLQGQVRGNFPQFIPKTDQERLQNIINKVLTMPEARWETTIKLDGSSCTIYYNKGTSGVCSRNLDLKLNDENKDNTFIKASASIREALEQLKVNVAIQGEVLGPGIQGNREGLKEAHIYIFDIFDIDEQKYFTPYERQRFMLDLNELFPEADLRHVPILAEDATLEDLGINNIDDALFYAGEYQSLFHNVPEGVVFKRMDGEFSFKIINNNYLLDNKD